MALRKPTGNNSKQVVSKYNESNPRNYSHLVDANTNFNLATITLENIDEAVFLEFNERFKIRGKSMPLISGDTETSSLEFLYPQLFNQDKEFLITPLFMYERSDSKKIFRTNPAYKQVIYTTPKKKAQGVVIEEWITEGPISWELVYDFTFISDFRESSNQMEEQINHYFRNKRNIITYNNEKFTIGPAEQSSILNLEIVNAEENSEKKLYVLTGSFIVWAYTRDLSNIQKRERPNSYTIDMVVKVEKNGVSKEIDSSKDQIVVERIEIDMEKNERPS